MSRVMAGYVFASPRRVCELATAPGYCRGGHGRTGPGRRNPYYPGPGGCRETMYTPGAAESARAAINRGVATSRKIKPEAYLAAPAG